MPVWLSGSAQRCSRCRLLLPLEAFNRLGDRRQDYCRDCFKAYVAGRRKEVRQQGQAAQEERIRRSQEHVLSILESRQCADCGGTDIVVLEFDHVRDKLEHVSTLTSNGRSLTRIDEEIERCDVVCVNCHRRRTARRAEWSRARPDWRVHLGRFAPRIARNLRHAYQHLERAGCVDCGIHDLVVLDFDHEGTKRFTVTGAAWSGLGLASIEREISVCRVRCGNCHRRLTALAARHYRSVPQAPLSNARPELARAPDRTM